MAISIGDETTDSSSRSLLACADVIGKSLLLKSMGLTCWIELDMDDERDMILREADLEGALDGVALREDFPRVDALFRSRIFRVITGILVSILFVMLCVDDSTVRRRFAICDSDSWLR